MSDTVDDLTKLEEISEPTVLHEVRHRYYNQQIHTHVGPSILLSVNPNKILNIYHGKNRKMNDSYSPST